MDRNGTEATTAPRQLVREVEVVQTDARSGDDPTSPARSRLEGPEWPRLGTATRHAEGAGDPVDLDLEIEDGETTLFEAAVGAFHSGEFQRAESLFLEEAQRTLDAAPQRAAISYRQAALAAGRMGNTDASDHWMRLAGREYLRVTEDDRTPLPFIREAAMMAAKCFLSVENLKVASKGLRRAQAIESVLRADDDLMAESSGAPFESHEADVDLRIERRATTRTASVGRPSGATVLPSASGPVLAPVEDDTTTPIEDDGADGRSGWLRRLWPPRPARHVA
jgi:hypothetical protein